MLDLYQLQQLLTVAECGTLSAAAQRLHLSQPALSRSMQRLEAELQVHICAADFGVGAITSQNRAIPW